MLVSENLARAQLGSAGAALGQRVAFSAQGPRWDVVGVVKDVHHEGVGQPAPQTVIRPVVASEAVAFVVRSPRAGTAGFLDELRKAVWSVNPNISLEAEQTLGDLYDHSMARSAMTLKLLAITGGIALLLGLIGIYGMVSYAISQRRREIGIRLALGARHGQVRRMFVRLALVLVGIGVAIGLAASAGLTRLMQSQLFGVSALDPADTRRGRAGAVRGGGPGQLRLRAAGLRAGPGRGAARRLKAGGASQRASTEASSSWRRALARAV